MDERKKKNEYQKKEEKTIQKSQNKALNFWT
jgi:hypothetical protein